MPWLSFSTVQQLRAAWSDESQIEFSSLTIRIVWWKRLIIYCLPNGALSQRHLGNKHYSDLGLWLHNCTRYRWKERTYKETEEMLCLKLEGSGTLVLPKWEGQWFLLYRKGLLWPNWEEQGHLLTKMREMDLYDAMSSPIYEYIWPTCPCRQYVVHYSFLCLKVFSLTTESVIGKVNFPFRVRVWSLYTHFSSWKKKITTRQQHYHIFVSWSKQHMWWHLLFVRIFIIVSSGVEIIFTSWQCIPVGIHSCSERDLGPCPLALFIAVLNLVESGGRVKGTRFSVILTHLVNQNCMSFQRNMLSLAHVISVLPMLNYSFSQYSEGKRSEDHII